MLGMMVGLALAFLVEMLNDLVRTPSDIRRFPHVPLLGIIPDADEDRKWSTMSIWGASWRRLRHSLVGGVIEGVGRISIFRPKRGTKRCWLPAASGTENIGGVTWPVLLWPARKFC